MLPLQTCWMLEKHRLQRHLVPTLVSEQNLHIHSFRPSFVTASAKTFSALTFPEIQDLHVPCPFVGGAALGGPTFQSFFCVVVRLFGGAGFSFHLFWWCCSRPRPSLGWWCFHPLSPFWAVLVLHFPSPSLGCCNAPHPLVPGGAAFFLLFGQYCSLPLPSGWCCFPPPLSVVRCCLPPPPWGGAAGLFFVFE